MKKTIFVFIIFLGIFNSIYGNVEKQLMHISLNDKVCMRKFFDFAIKVDQAGHVLRFDTKPVCLTCLAIKDKYKSFRDTLCLRGWKAFKKHEALFSHPNFVFNEILYEEGDFKILDIYIINKSALRKHLNEHKQIFKSYLGENFTPENFIHQLESGQTLVSLVNKNEVLLGILMGFGEESSKAYQEAQNVNDSIPEWSESYCGIDAPQPRGCKIYPVSFMGNPQSPKTQQLLSVYKNELESIWDEYQKKNDSLLFFLEHLCRERSDDFSTLGNPTATSDINKRNLKAL